MTLRVIGVTESGFEKVLSNIDINSDGDNFVAERGDADYVQLDTSLGHVEIDMTRLPKELKTVRLQLSSY